MSTGWSWDCPVDSQKMSRVSLSWLFSMFSGAAVLLMFLMFLESSFQGDPRCWGKEELSITLGFFLAGCNMLQPIWKFRFHGQPSCQAWFCHWGRAHREVCGPSSTLKKETSHLPYILLCTWTLHETVCHAYCHASLTHFPDMFFFHGPPTAMILMTTPCPQSNRTLSRPGGPCCHRPDVKLGGFTERNIEI